MFVTRFIESSGSSDMNGPAATGEWTTRYDMLTRKQTMALKIVEELKITQDEMKAKQAKDYKELKSMIAEMANNVRKIKDKI